MPRIDEDAVRELEIYIETSSEPAYRKSQQVYKNLVRKFEKGQYDHRKAPKAWSYVVTQAAKDYVKEFGARGESYHRVFPKMVRDRVAKKLADTYFERMKAGESAI